MNNGDEKFWKEREKSQEEADDDTEESDVGYLQLCLGAKGVKRIRESSCKR